MLYGASLCTAPSFSHVFTLKSGNFDSTPCFLVFCGKAGFTLNPARRMEAADVIYFRIQINFTNVCHSTQRFQAQKLEYFLSIPINMDEQRGGGGGYAARLFLLFSYSSSADHERDWPPCKVVFFWVGNQYVRNNNNDSNSRNALKQGNLCRTFTSKFYCHVPLYFEAKL